MRNFWNRCVCIVILQFVILGIAYPASLFVEEPDTVMASTDNYTAIFREGSLLHFHNNLTQETYTQNDYRADTWVQIEHRRLKPEHLTPKIKRYSPLEIELIYKDSWSDPRDNEVELRLFISIDSQTGDLLVRQRVFSEMGGINAIMWGFSNLSHTVVDIIAPVYGGQILTEESKRYYYPGSWESQLAILQGQRGGVFVRSDDAQYHFKTLEYSTEGDSFSLNFWQIPPVPFEHQKQVTTATWRLNAYQGDWHVPALAYREWMHEALRPVDRTQMPDWVDDIELVITHADPLWKAKDDIDYEKTRYVCEAAIADGFPHFGELLERGLQNRCPIAIITQAWNNLRMLREYSQSDKNKFNVPLGRQTSFGKSGYLNEEGFVYDV